MTSLRQTLTAFAAAGTLSFSAIVLAAWPYETHADDPQAAAAAQRDIGSHVSKIGAMEAKSRLAKEPGSENSWFVEVEVSNPNDKGPEKGTYAVNLHKTDLSESMGRSGPIPTVAFSRVEEVVVPAGETVVKRYPLSETLCRQVEAAFGKTAKGVKAVPRTRFQTYVSAIRAPASAASVSPQPGTATPQQTNRTKLRPQAVQSKIYASLRSNQDFGF